LDGGDIILNHAQQFAAREMCLALILNGVSVTHLQSMRFINKVLDMGYFPVI
jgi:hypothetical protein